MWLQPAASPRAQALGCPRSTAEAEAGAQVAAVRGGPCSQSRGCLPPAGLAVLASAHGLVALHANKGGLGGLQAALLPGALRLPGHSQRRRPRPPCSRTALGRGPGGEVRLPAKHTAPHLFPSEAAAFATEQEARKQRRLRARPSGGVSRTRCGRSTGRSERWTSPPGVRRTVGTHITRDSFKGARTSVSPHAERPLRQGLRGRGATHAVSG